MRQKKVTYLYKDRQFIGEFESATQAAQHAGETTMVARNVLSKRCKITRKGYHYSYRPLSEEEMQQLPIREEKQPKQQQKEKTYKTTYREVDGFRFEVEPNNPNLFQFPRNRKGKVELLKQFIFTHMEKHWSTIPRNVAVLQKQFVKDLCNSIV